jgi:hypothetical protein
MMAEWPQNPVATMEVDSYHGGTACSITSHSTAAPQTVLDANIDFRVDISFHDHPWFDNGRGYFSAQLEKLTTNGWQSVAYRQVGREGGARPDVDGGGRVHRPCH